MFKAWLLIFIWNPAQNYAFIEKVEVPFKTMAECRMSMKDSRTGFSPVYKVRKFCVTDDHHEGRTVDKNIPLEPTPFGYRQ